MAGNKAVFRPFEMKIIFHKKFEKSYRKLSAKLQIKVDETLEIFQSNPFDQRLRNHALKDDLKGKRALSVTGDIRIIFEEHENYTFVYLLHVGKHTQVYKRF